MENRKKEVLEITTEVVYDALVYSLCRGRINKIEIIKTILFNQLKIAKKI